MRNLSLPSCLRLAFTMLVSFIATSEVAVARSTFVLDGRWELAVGDEKPAVFDRVASVPGIVTMAEPAPEIDVHGADKPDDYKLPWRSVWYRRTFRVEGPPRPVALLKVRARYNARVFLNDVELGSDPHSTYGHGIHDASRALVYGGNNELLIQVGTWETATWPSRERDSCWWRSSRSPGLWDSVVLETGEMLLIETVQIIPGADLRSATARVTVKNESEESVSFTVFGTISPKAGGQALDRRETSLDLGAGASHVVELPFVCPGVIPWSAGHEGTPALYEAYITTVVEGREVDRSKTVFGFRTVEVRGADFLINGQRTFLRAGNIVFNRAMLRWAPQIFDRAWVRRFFTLLRDEYGYNYLRFHLGHAPDFWYDIADEVGLMVQDQWRYFHDSDPQGVAREHTRVEFARWITQNRNHPSIVIWDKQNEGEISIPEIVAEMRALDPTRPWLEEDFDATHVYQYSETDTDTVVDQPAKDRPSAVLESCRFWLNERGLPEPREAFKTVRTATAWNLHYYTVDDAMRLQADLHADIGGFYRANRFTGWAPFVILSGPYNGQTFFMGDLAREFRPKANMEILRDLHATFGLTVEMWQAREWYRLRTVYEPGALVEKTVSIWNDEPRERAGTVVARVLDATRGATLSEQRFAVRVPAGGCIRQTVRLGLPAKEGVVLIRCELLDETGKHAAFSARRRLMVASADRPELTGVDGFGGRFQPVCGAVYFGDAYLGAPVPEAVRTTITRELAGVPVGALKPRKEGGYRLEAGSSKERIALEIANDGRLLKREVRTRVAYADLPAIVQVAITKGLGMVPIDEVMIVRLNEKNGTRYEVEAVWQGEAKRFAVDDTGHRLP